MVNITKVVPFSLPRASDVITALTDLAKEHNISCAFVHCIGAIEPARLAYYDLKTRSYQPIEISERVELLSCSGNISIRDSAPWPHLHAVVSNPNGQTFGGHLLNGSLAFLVEGFIFAMDATIHRIPDPSTGLTVWKL